jgi:hypothetical protein
MKHCTPRASAWRGSGLVHDRNESARRRCASLSRCSAMLLSKEIWRDTPQAPRAWGVSPRPLLRVTPLQFIGRSWGTPNPPAHGPSTALRMQLRPCDPRFALLQSCWEEWRDTHKSPPGMGCTPTLLARQIRWNDARGPQRVPGSFEGWDESFGSLRMSPSSASGRSDFGRVAACV